MLIRPNLTATGARLSEPDGPRRPDGFIGPNELIALVFGELVGSDGLIGLDRFHWQLDPTGSLNSAGSLDPMARTQIWHKY